MTKKATAHELAIALGNVGYMAYKLTLGGVPPWMSAVGRRMADLREGDMVMETTTHHGRGAYPPEMRIGRFIRCVREPIAIEWNEAEDGPHPDEKVFYILGLDGVEHRWTNANFIAIPTVDWEDQLVVSDEEIERFQRRA